MPRSQAPHSQPLRRSCVRRICLISTPPVPRLRNLLRILILLFTTAILSAPVAALGFHTTSHAVSPVANGEHHHHDEDGGVATHDADRDAASESEEAPKGSFGHSHMANTAFDLVAQVGSDLPEGAVEPAPTPAAANTPALGTLGWTPQKRPPRTA